MCKANPAQKWNAGWGLCATYAKGKANNFWCDKDQKDGVYAHEACAECNLCTAETDAKSCKDWNCAQWCQYYDSKFDAIYAEAGCNDDGEECNCDEPKPVAYSCPTLSHKITNTQCDGMQFDEAATAAKCEESCCGSKCKTWLFKEGKGCYQTASKCTVMWQGVGGAAGWSGSSSQPVSTKCECRQCGSAVAFPYGGGNCGVASATCSATVGGAGCYSSASSGCDCKSLTTV